MTEAIGTNQKKWKSEPNDFEQIECKTKTQIIIFQKKGGVPAKRMRDKQIGVLSFAAQ